ncbi:uncharacterized protein N7483_012227 [Penicillium malachiteum]|uniref:uncharacterized protein n=1 Tax=Penicillium malachiteum TaxID=1324776 RepID=UPI0025473F5E|nr:uncharacterized protein N7483_012227 [Penicillium malachiteum]KAJ5715046.1 hypothetical protein N7483_012227 [Penicillium malachiteum]
MDTQEISAVHSILHLIYHRNKNQHKRTKWWKWLSMLKRITSQLESLDSAAAERYQQHLAAHLIPRCYQAFSTVVAENQFSTLGIALLAALARLAKASGADRKMAAVPKLKQKKIPVSVPSEDRGERITRSEEDEQPGSTKIRESSKKEKSSKKASSAKPAKKTKKKKKDAIDDLFSGLF